MENTLAGHPLKHSVHECEIGECVLEADAGELVRRDDGTHYVAVEVEGGLVSFHRITETIDGIRDPD